MKEKREIGLYFCTIVLLICAVGLFGIVSAVENTGQGKPKGLEIYVEDVPYGSSLGGAVKSGEKAVGDFNVIVDDTDPNKPDPGWFTQMGITPTPTATPTMAPTPTATIPIPVDFGGVGARLCVTDNTSDVIVDFAYSSAGYKNTFYLIQPRYQTLGWSQGEMPNGRTGDPFGKQWVLGKFPVGTELVLADNAYEGSTEKGLYLTGPASRNSDNFIHAAITLKNSTGTHHKYLVSFEDAQGGGDRDYNDVEFYVSGDVSTACSEYEDDEDDSGGGSLIPVYTGNICRCGGSYGNNVCVAEFSYNTTADGMAIPVRSKSLPWNEFTGSGWTSPTKQYHCQPEIFYVDKRNAPFWTSPFWNNIDWKLGHLHSSQASCTKYDSRHYDPKDKKFDPNRIPFCADLGVTCSECAS